MVATVVGSMPHCLQDAQLPCGQSTRRLHCRTMLVALTGLSALQIFADKRYQRHDKRDKLPAWITAHLKDSHMNLSTDMLMTVAKEFMRSMAQPMDSGQGSLLTEEAVNAMAQLPPQGMIM